jgi:hypothetical protein
MRVVGVILLAEGCALARSPSVARAAGGVSCSPAPTCLPVRHKFSQCAWRPAPILGYTMLPMSLRSRPYAPLFLMWPSRQLAFSLALVVFHPVLGFLVFAFVCPPCHGTTGPTPPCSRRLHHLQLACSLAWCSPSVCFSVPKFFLGCRGTQSSLQRSRLCAWHHLRHLSSLSFASNCPSALGSLQTTPSWRLTALAIDDQPRLCTYHGAQFDSYMGPS